MIRAVNASLDPERVAEALVSRVLGVAARAGLARACRSTAAGGRGRWPRDALTPPLEPAAQAVGAVGHAQRRGVLLGRTSPRIAALRTTRLRPRRSAFRSRAAAGRSARWSALDRAPSATRAAVCARRRSTALLAGIEPGAIALENALRVQRAEALSVTDDLTQLYNSRYLSQVLRRETKRASRSGRPLSLLFVDLDGFKSINDTHGHLFGSRALVEAASVIRASARETDMVARFGGDEFALILPDTGSEGAAAVGERVRDRIAAFSFLQGDGLTST